MQEVQRQIGPLAEQVAKIGNNVERLYNSNGGPPGYLQTARSEDKGRFEMIFNILDEHKADIQPIKDFMRDHEIREKDRDRKIRPPHGEMDAALRCPRSTVPDLRSQ